MCYDIDPDKEWKKRYLALMNTVADYTEGLTDRVRERMESYNNFNLPQPSFREIEARPTDIFDKLGYKDSVLINRLDSTEFFALQDCAQISIITKLVPNRKNCVRAVKLLSDAFNKIDLSIHERNLPLYFIDGYYRSNYRS